MDISVIGLGKLGSPLAAVLAAAGHRVVGVDTVPHMVDAINKGVAPVVEPGLQERIDASRGRLSATLDIAEAVRRSSISYVIVPTPSEPDGEFSLRYIIPAVEAIGSAVAAKGAAHTVVITSTVMPGHTDGPIRKALESSSRIRVGADIGLAYSPEFIALGSVVHDMCHPDMILIGESDRRVGDLVEEIALSYTSRGASPHVARLSIVDSEVAKLAVNTFVTTKISYANMLADLCERLPGANADAVALAIGFDSRIGGKYLQPATAYGGPCFPRDNVALTSLARRLGARADLAEATHNINRYQVDRLADRVDALIAPGEGKVAVLGVTYKAGTPVIEEAVGPALVARLFQKGHKVVAYDPLGSLPTDYQTQIADVMADSLRSAVSSARVIVITTPWPEFSDLGGAGVGAEGETVDVLDCWRVTDRNLGGSVNVHYPGTSLHGLESSTGER